MMNGWRRSAQNLKPPRTKLDREKPCRLGCDELRPMRSKQYTKHWYYSYPVIIGTVYVCTHMYIEYTHTLFI